MSFKNYIPSLTALFLAVSIQGAEAEKIHVPLPPAKPKDLNLPVSAFLNFTAAAKPLKAQVQFCVDMPGECQDHMKPQRVRLTDAVWSYMNEINQKVNKEIKPLTDQDNYGVVDKWTYPDNGSGDCEDYQLLKQKLLREAGFPQSAMRHAVVTDENGDGHAVLLIRTNRGDFMLDNKRNAILALSATGYNFVKSLSPTSDFQWQGPADEKILFADKQPDKDTMVMLDPVRLAHARPLILIKAPTYAAMPDASRKELSDMSLRP